MKCHATNSVCVVTFYVSIFYANLIGKLIRWQNGISQTHRFISTMTNVENSFKIPCIFFSSFALLVQYTWTNKRQRDRYSLIGKAKISKFRSAVTQCVCSWFFFVLFQMYFTSVIETLLRIRFPLFTSVAIQFMTHKTPNSTVNSENQTNRNCVYFHLNI